MHATWNVEKKELKNTCIRKYWEKKSLPKHAWTSYLNKDTDDTRRHTKANKALKRYEPEKNEIFLFLVEELIQNGLMSRNSGDVFQFIGYHENAKYLHIRSSWRECRYCIPSSRRWEQHGDPWRKTMPWRFEGFPIVKKRSECQVPPRCGFMIIQ